MTFQQCKYLVEISKHNSIGKAANALYVTQPSISKAIRELENELGITIFDRTNKGVLLTADGEKLLFYAQMLVEQSNAAVYHFKKQIKTPFTKLSISSQHYGFAIEAAAQLVNHLSGMKYELTIHEGKTTDVIDEVAANRSIVGVLSISNQNKDYFERVFAEKSLAFTPLQSVRQYVFLRKAHPLANCRPIALEQLAQYPYLTYQQDDMPLYFAEEPINVNALSQIVYLKDRGAMNNLLANTNGFNLGTGCIVENYMNPNIISIPLERGSTIEIGYIKRYDILLPNEMVCYIDFLSQSLQNAVPKE